MPYASVSRLAELTGKSPRTIRRRLETLEPRRVSGNRHDYDTREALPLVVCATAKEGLDLQDERAQLAREQRIKYELENQLRRGELVEVEAAAASIERFVTDLRAKLLAMPTKVAPLVIKCRTIPEARDMIDDYLRDALEEFQRARENRRKPTELVAE